MADLALVAERRVRGLAAQSRPIVLALDGHRDGVGHAHRLAVLLLRQHTWQHGRREGERTERDRDEKRGMEFE